VWLITDDKDKILCRDGKSDSAARKKATWEKVVDVYYLLDLPIQSSKNIILMQITDGSPPAAYKRELACEFI